MLASGNSTPILALAALAWGLAAPLQAQDYIDVEGGRAAGSQPAGADEAASEPYDPYRVQPAQAYPATSFGAAGAGGPAPAAGGQDLGNLLFQLQQLQQEVMMLNGKVEEQAFEIERLKTQLQERYVDLDRRIAAMGGNPAQRSGSGAAAAVDTTPEPATASPVPAPRSSAPAAAEQPGEGEAYRAAYALVRGQQWDAAIRSFNRFLQNYPAGRYAPNAHYWLGELYLVTSPPQLENSRQSFMLLLTEYPDNNKVPDALYKLGKVHFQKGNPEKGREYLDRVINEYGDSNSTAVRLARDFIKENY
jgi:tol-pal system protein YbgF